MSVECNPYMYIVYIVFTLIHFGTIISSCHATFYSKPS